MARLIYSMLTSLDGYTADGQGDFGWAAPAEEVHAYVNQLAAPVGVYLYGSGRRDPPARLPRRRRRGNALLPGRRADRSDSA